MDQVSLGGSTTLLNSLLQITSYACAFVGLALVYTFITYVIKSELAWRQFRKQSRGLPMKGGRRLFGNHTLDQLMENSSHVLRREHDRLGHPSTIGMLWGDYYAASTTDLDLMESIVLKGANINKRTRVDVPMGLISTSLVFSQDDDWRKLRTNLAPAVRSSNFKVPQVLQDIEEATKNLTDHIDRKLNETNGDARDGVTFQADDLSLMCITDFALSVFYKRKNSVDYNDRNTYWVKAAREGAESTLKHPLAKACIFLPPLMPILNKIFMKVHPLGRGSLKIVEMIKDMTEEAIEARRIHSQKLAKEGKQLKPGIIVDNVELPNGKVYRRNMLDHITDRYLEGHLETDEYLNGAHILSGASIKTTADAICHVLYRIALHQDVQEKLRQSIMTSGMDSEYLSWVINESLRLLSPGLDGGSRTLKEDLEIENGKYVLPKGTFVMPNTYVVHRLKKYWGPDAEEFKPERWQHASKHHPMQYLPFGIGNRICPGKDLALYEMNYVVAQLLVRYRLETTLKRDVDDFDSPFFLFMIPKTPTYITFKRLEV